MDAAALQAGFWGLVAGGALVLGAVAGYRFAVPQRLIASIMAFGSGVLISALSFELVEEAYDRGGFVSTSPGLLAGAAIFTGLITVAGFLAAFLLSKMAE